MCTNIQFQYTKKNIFRYQLFPQNYLLIFYCYRKTNIQLLNVKHFDTQHELLKINKRDVIRGAGV